MCSTKFSSRSSSVRVQSLVFRNLNVFNRIPTHFDFHIIYFSRFCEINQFGFVSFK